MNQWMCDLSPDSHISRLLLEPVHFRFDVHILLKHILGVYCVLCLFSSNPHKTMQLYTVFNKCIDHPSKTCLTKNGMVIWK